MSRSACYKFLYLLYNNKRWLVLDMYDYILQAPENGINLALDVPKEMNTFVAERFLSGLVNVQRKQPVSTD